MMLGFTKKMKKAPMSKETEIAKLTSVSYDKDTDDVFITFKVMDDKYKDYVLRWAKKEEGRLAIRGEVLSVVEKKGQMRVAPGKDV